MKMTQKWRQPQYNEHDLKNEKHVDADNIVDNTSLAAPGALAHRLQRRTACNT